MKTTAELLERISPRYKKVRNSNLDFLWEDFLLAVEKVTNVLSDEKLAATQDIAIYYFTKKGDENIYRRKTAEANYFHDQIVEYEESDICLGTREMLEIAFKDFKDKAKKDNNFIADWFEVENFKFDEDDDSEIVLYFKLPREL